MKIKERGRTYQKHLNSSENTEFYIYAQGLYKVIHSGWCDTQSTKAIRMSDLHLIYSLFKDELHADRNKVLSKAKL